MADFKRSLAVVIGINEYQHEQKLHTARYDAERLAEILAIEHNYDYVILVTDETYKEYRQGQELPVKNKYQPTLDGLLNLLSKRLPAEIKPTKEDRLLFYFAGHGIPDDSDEGPKGYLVPLDGDSKKRDSLLPMQELYKCLAALNCRHFLIILDCCFAGRFSWSSSRKGRTFPKVIHKEHYDRFINSPAWQAITSASHDQEAFDILGDRKTVAGTNHSPFAKGLFKALQGKADVFPPSKNGQPAGDGVITATELYLYLRDHVEIGSKERQTPGLWSLPKHDRGEYIFLVPGDNLRLKPAPNVNEKNNPYRGLESFDEEYSRFFFGREELIEQLSERISAPKQPLTVVLGVSGSGKSSLVKAGLIPCLRKLSQSEVFEVNFVSAYPKFWPINYVHQWHILNPIRPGESPFTALAKAILALADVTGSNQPDTLNFLKVSTRLDKLTFITEILKEKVNDLDRKLAESSSENGEESAETLRLKKELEKFISMAKAWHQSTQKAKQLLIVEHFEELFALCRNPAEKRQLQQVVSDCLNPLSQRLQSDPNQLIDIVRAWSQKNPGVRLLLTIDQFEELITLSQSKQKDKQNNQQQQWKKFWNWLTQKVQQKNKQEEWQQFLNLLEKTLSANLDRLRIIVTLRSDFEPRFLNSDALKSYWTKARFPVRAMRSDELRQAIERPASEMALYFEPPILVDRLIDEVGQMPGALPLLSFTLSELYIKLAQKWIKGETSDRALRLDADFDKEGGVAGSLTRRANEEYNNLPDDAHRDTLRRVMLRMVTFEGGELARRRVPLSELVYADAVENKRVKLVLERFNHARLIVSGQETGEPYVEPAHDFLVRSWDKLQEWQQEEQEDLSLQRRLTPAALEWKSKQEARFLWNADPYLDVLNQVLTDEKDNWFNQVEAEFVQKSVRRRRRNVNLRWGSAIAVMLGLSGLTIVALIGQRNAQIAQIRAFQQASEANLRSNQEFDALIESLRAGKSLKQPLLQLFKPDNQIQNQLKATLQKAVYQVKERNRLKGGDRASSVTVSSSPKNGQLLATAGDDGTVRLWNLQGKQLKEWSTGPRPALSFSSDGQQLATAEANTVRLWDLQGNKLQEWNVEREWNAGDWLAAVSFSPNGQQLATTGSTGTVRLWSLQGQPLKEQNPLKEWNAGQNWIWNTSFSPLDGQRLVTVGFDGTFRLWDLQGKQLIGWKVSQWPLRNVSFSPDGQLLAITGDNDVALLWNLQENKPYELKRDHRIGNVSFSPDGQRLATVGEDGTVDLRDLQGQPPEQWKGNQGPLTGVSFSLDGQLLATAGSSDTVRLWDLRGQPLTELKPQEMVKSVSFSPSGQRLTTVGENSTVAFWNLQGHLLKELQGNKRNITSVSFSPDGQRFVTAEHDGIARLWDLQGQLLKELQGNERKITSVSFIPNGQQLATREEDGTVRLWNSMTGQLLVKFPRKLANDSSSPDDYITNDSFSPDGQRLATIKDHDYVHLWDWQGQRVAETSIGHRGGVSSFGFSPDSKLLATAGNDGFLRVWKLQGQTLEPFSVWQATQGSIRKLKFSPDGQQLATAGEDGTVRLWDLKGQPLATWRVDQGLVWSIAFRPDGRLLATAGSDGKAKLLPIESLDELMKRGCDWARDYLQNNPDVSKSDRRLCDDIPPITPSPQTTIANSSTPSIVQPSAQNAPSPTPSYNNGQNTPSSSAPANAPARPQNVPSPTPPSNNGQNNYRQAPSDRKQASKLNSTSVDAYINQGLTYHRQRNYQQAISSYSKAIALNSNSATAYSNRAVTYIEQKDYPKAIADSSKAISLNPNYVNAYINRGLAYYRQGNSQQAIANYNKAIELAPGNANAYNNRALAYTRLGNQQAAQADKRKAAALSQRQSQ